MELRLDAECCCEIDPSNHGSEQLYIPNGASSILEAAVASKSAFVFFANEAQRYRPVMAEIDLLMTFESSRAFRDVIIMI